MIRAGAFCCVVFLLAGCGGGSGPPLPSTAPAKGKITLPSGQPLRAGRLELVAVVKPPGIDAFADVNNDGTFTVQAFSAEGGAVPGEYVVVVTPFDYHAKKGNIAKIPNAAEIPKRYQDAQTSDLKITIEAGKDNFFDLKMKN